MEETKRMRNILLGFAIKYNNDYAKIVQAIRAKEPLEESDLEKLKKIKGETITIVDKDYPDFLKMQDNPPLVLFLDVRDQRQFKDKYSAIQLPNVREAFISHFTLLGFFLEKAAEAFDEEMKKEKEEEFDTSNLA
jgi:hypothetical protein